MNQRHHHIQSALQASMHISCPIARIEAERRISPMAMLVARTTQQPSFF